MKKPTDGFDDVPVVSGQFSKSVKVENSQEVKPQATFGLVPDHAERLALKQGKKPASFPGFSPSDEDIPGAAGSTFRGMPSAENLSKLATVWLEHQALHWPALVGGEALPPLSTAAVARLVEVMAGTQQADDRSVMPETSRLSGLALGAAYLRYSCDTSSPRSLDDQLVNVLRKAASDRIFIPWNWVFADAAVSGTVSARPAYQRMQTAVLGRTGGSSASANAAATGHQEPTVLYVDELSRASRDQVEMLKLGRRLSHHAKRLVGVVDSFDSEQPAAKMQLQMLGMINEAFIDQLKPRIQRGMRGAARRGTATGKPAFGYRHEVVVDDAGRPVLREKGKVTKRLVVDADQAVLVRRVFAMFADDGRSLSWIARFLDRLKAGGRKAWSAASVGQMLRRRTYIGVLVFGRNRYPKDPDTGRLSTRIMPDDQCEIIDCPELAIVSEEVFVRARQRLEEVGRARPGRGGNGKSRSELYPTHVLSGLLYCEKHGTNLGLYRSNGRYHDWVCHRCSATARAGESRSKSGRLIEQTLFDGLGELFSDAETVADIARRANAYVRASSPASMVEKTEVEAALRRVRSEADRLHRLILDYGEGRDLSAYLDEESAKRKEAEHLAKRLGELSVAVDPVEVTEAQVVELLKDLPELMRADPTRANRLLRRSAGRIAVEKVQEPGHKKATWVLKPEIDFVAILAEQSRCGDCPTSCTWEYLSARNWRLQIPASFVVDDRPASQRLAVAALRQWHAGATAEEISVALGLAPRTVTSALAFARSGRVDARDNYHTTQGCRRPLQSVPLYIQYAAACAEQRRQGRSFDDIARMLDVSTTTVKAGLRYAHRSADQPTGSRRRAS